MVTKATEPKNEVTHKVELTIEEEPYIEMMKYAHEFSPDECSGVGLVERVDYDTGEVEFVVKKVYLPNQTNSGAATDIEDDELNRLNTQLVEDGEDTSLLRFHWHSHVDMAVFHSGTDESNYDDMGTGEYAVSLVVNKKYDMLGSVHLYSPIRINVLNLEVNPPVIDLDTYELPDVLKAKIQKNVDRVKAYEEEQAKKKFKPITHYGWNKQNVCDKCGKTYFYCDCYAETINKGGDYGMGLQHDPALYALLRQGEKSGLITLIYDEDKITIVGYMNPLTQECFELTSYADYVTY